MNGFASAILSILLGWLRALFDNLWKLLSSASGGSFLTFLRLHWQAVFLALCVGGFVLDRIIFFFRWRPDYVWSTRLGRLKRRLSRKEAPRERAAYQRPVAASAPQSPEAFAPYQEVFAPHQEGFAPYQEPYAPQQEPYQEPYAAYQAPPPPPLEAYGVPSPMVQDFAPLAGPGPEVSYPVQSFAEVQPVFDEPTEVWAALPPQLPVDAYQQPYENPAMDLAPGFGASRPEPEAYLRDVQAGFAPPLAPEALYPQPQREPPPGNEPVHPGLDLETFQQNIGLVGSGEPSQPEEPLLKPLVDFPDTSYVAYYREAEPGAPARSTGGLASFAKKARELVRINDETNQPTIRDLQPTANIKTAFHSPVLPKKSEKGDEE